MNKTLLAIFVAIVFLTSIAYYLFPLGSTPPKSSSEAPRYRVYSLDTLHAPDGCQYVVLIHGNTVRDVFRHSQKCNNH